MVKIDRASKDRSYLFYDAHLPLLFYIALKMFRSTSETFIFGNENSHHIGYSLVTEGMQLLFY